MLLFKFFIKIKFYKPTYENDSLLPVIVVGHGNVKSFASYFGSLVVGVIELQ